MTPEIRTLFVPPGGPVLIRVIGLLPDAADSILVELHADRRVSALLEHRGPEPSVDQRRPVLPRHPDSPLATETDEVERERMRDRPR